MPIQTVALKDHLALLEQTALRGAIWAFVGVVFGFVFVVLTEYLQGVVPPVVQLFAATAGAAALTSLFYGSMRLSVMVANFTFIAMVVYTWGNSELTLEPLISVGAVVGLTVGATYGWLDKKSRVFCADAKIVAGLFAGLLASGLVFLLRLFVEMPYPWVAMFIAPAATVIYVSSAYWFVDRCHGFLPPVGGGALVGLGVGSMTGLLFMIMAATLDPASLGMAFHQSFVERVQDVWANTVGSAAGVCFAVGVLRSLCKVPWYNL